MVSLHCPLCCDQPFEDQQSLFFHLRGLRNNLFCPICSERFSSLELLVTHLSRKCHGPQTPSEAKRRCLTSISSSDKSDFEDEFNKNESQPSKTQVNDVRLSTQIPVEIPGKFLKNVSISLKEPVEKSPKKQNSGVKFAKPLMVAVDPKNPLLTNGLPLNSVLMSDSDTSLGNTENEIEPETRSLNITSANTPAKDITSSGSSHEPALTNGLSTHINHSKNAEHAENSSIARNKRKIQGKSDEECQEVNEVTNSSDTSVHLVTTTAASKAHSTPSTPLSVQQQVSKCDQVVPKRKRGRPRKDSILPTMNSAGKTTPLKCSNVVKDAVVNSKTSCSNSGKQSNNNASSMPLRNDSDDDTGHFEESMDHNESQPDDNMEIDTTENRVDNCKQKGATDTGNTTETSKGKDINKPEEEEEYTCSACDVRFTSIYEHIKEFHNGEEVVVEVPEEEIKEDLKAYQNEGEESLQKANATSNEKIPSEASAFVPSLEVGKSPDEDVQIIEEINTCPDKSSISKKSTCVTLQKQNFELNKQYAKQINKLNRSSKGEWLRTRGAKRSCFHFVKDRDKMVRLLSEFKDNCKLHPDFKVSFKDLFENPKINVISITNRPNTPFFTYRQVDLSKPIPMYIIVRQFAEPDSLLGGIASYVLANPSKESSSSRATEETKLIAVMKVLLGIDQTLTVENLVFKNKPAVEGMVPVLEDVSEPEIPMLEGGKMLKWRCNKCLVTTWKFPLNRDSHMCNGCLICHKPFATPIALKKHMFVHKKNSSNYCEKCHIAFISSKVMENHQAEHENHNICSICNLFVPIPQQEAHKQLHSRLPANQFPCSVCHKMFASGEEVKAHETKICGRLVAKYTCSLCDKKFFSLTALSFHTRDHKYVTIKFPCRFCSKTFLKEKEQCPRKAGKRKPSSYLQKIWHERIHTRDRPFLCSACPKRFRSLDHLTIHSNQAHFPSKHKDVPIHMCGICDKLFQNAQKLEKHKREQHMSQQST